LMKRGSRFFGHLSIEECLDVKGRGKEKKKRRRGAF